VVIFFVVSGFVMAHTTEGAKLATSPVLQARIFLINRFIRVVPLYWLALLSWIVLMHVSFAEPGVWKDFLFIARENPVRPGRWWPSLIPGWTINYEVFFYGLFAVAMLLGRWRRQAMVLGLLALVICGYAVPRPVSAWSFYTNNILLAFAFGIIVQGLWRHVRLPWSALAWAVLATVAMGLMLLPLADLPKGLFYGLPAALLVWSAAHLGQHMAWRGLEMLGAASYSLYLWHTHLFKVSRSISYRLGWVVESPVEMTLAVVLHVIAAVLCGLWLYRWLEQPLMRWLRARLQRFV
jgi:exopolysaccharide production protein ExoZ